MAASNRNLEVEIEAGRFRRDLFYRLSVVTLAVPPLRDRREDICPLAESYVDYLGPRIGSNVSTRLVPTAPQPITCTGPAAIPLTGQSEHLFRSARESLAASKNTTGSGGTTSIARFGWVKGCS